MVDVKMIERGLKKPGKTKGGLAAAMGVRPGAVSEILSDIRLIKASEIQPIIDYLDLNSVPIMGRVGAGATIEPEHEQVPPEGLGEIELPFPIAEETIAFEVSGDSMLPKYENGDIIVVYRDQRHPISSFYGEEAAVRLKTGERYLKTVERGKSPTVVNSPASTPSRSQASKWNGSARSASRFPGARSSACAPRPPPAPARPIAPPGNSHPAPPALPARRFAAGGGSRHAPDALLLIIRNSALD